MAVQEHLDILMRGVDAWNEWRIRYPTIHPDLSTMRRPRGIEERYRGKEYARSIKVYLPGADLRIVDFHDTALMGSNLSGADLRSANLMGANLQTANLSGADLRSAHLLDATLYGTNLSRANLSGANLAGANLSYANLTGADLTGAVLKNAVLVQTKLCKAILTGCRVYGISVWDVNVAEAEQSSLIITDYFKPTITVDDLEVAQFMYLLLNHKKLRNVLNAVTKQGVLILGRFGGGGLEMLQAIAAKLREENYLPIMFDFERPQDRNYTETIKTLAGLARFVIADLSGPSVPQELYATVPHFKIPFVPIIEASRKPYSMAMDIFEYPWVVRPPVAFATTEGLLEQLPTKVIAPAEEKYQARQKLLDELFNKA